MMNYDHILTKEDLERILERMDLPNSEKLQKLVGLPVYLVDALSLVLIWMLREVDSDGSEVALKLIESMSKTEASHMIITLISMLIAEAQTHEPEEKRNSSGIIFKRIFNDSIESYKASKEKMRENG